MYTCILRSLRSLCIELISAEFLLKYDRCGTIMDFLVTMLAENESVVMSTHNAASWGYYDTVKKSWNEQVSMEFRFAS